MDTKFQTSFIPKKTSVVEQKTIKHGKTTSVLTFISVMIFVISVAGAIFSVLWKNVLLKSQENFQTTLGEAEKKFDVKLVDDLRRSSAKLDFGSKLLKQHIAVSEIFSILSTLTIEGVKFNSLEFNEAKLESGGSVSMKLKGVGSSFSAIAYQSDVFGQSEKFGKNKVLKNPIISDLTIQENGSVAFTFSANISPTDISYETSIGESANSSNQ